MKPKIRKSQKTQKRLKKRTQCPACGSTDLITEPADQICCDCDWNTFQEFVDAGLMDNVPLAVVEHFCGVNMFKGTDNEAAKEINPQEDPESKESEKNINLKQIA